MNKLLATQIYSPLIIMLLNGVDCCDRMMDSDGREESVCSLELSPSSQATIKISFEI